MRDLELRHSHTSHPSSIEAKRHPSVSELHQPVWTPLLPSFSQTWFAHHCSRASTMASPLIDLISDEPDLPRAIEDRTIEIIDLTKSEDGDDKECNDVFELTSYYSDQCVNCWVSRMWTCEYPQIMSICRVLIIKVQCEQCTTREYDVRCPSPQCKRDRVPAYH